MTLLSGLLIVLPMQAVGIAWFRSAEDYKALVALLEIDALDDGDDVSHPLQ